MSSPDEPPTDRRETTPAKEKYRFCADFKQQIREPKFAIEVAAFVVLFIYAGFTGYQAWKVKQSTDAATKSADAAVASVRAWLAVIDYKIPDPVDVNNGIFEIDIKNVGKLPSTGMSITAEFRYLDAKASPIQIGVCPEKRISVYGPMQADQLIPLKPPLERLNLSKEQVGALTTHTANLAIHGCLHYGTVPLGFGDTEFCSVFYAFADKNISLPCGTTIQVMK
jgi:hypothetical protein